MKGAAASDGRVADFLKRLEELKVDERELRVWFGARDGDERGVDRPGSDGPGGAASRTDGPAPDKIVDASLEGENRVLRDEIADLRRELLSQTERRVAAEAASRAKTEFLGVLSHEIRTPLQAVVGYTDLLESGVHGPVSPVQLEDLRRMQRSEQHLLRIINGVLDFLKLESGIGGDLQPRSFSVPDVLRGVHTLIAPQLEAKGLVFISNYDEPTANAHADPVYVQQIVLNLAANAIKHTSAPGTLTIETEDDGEFVAVRVRDTGAGIPPSMLEAIFEPFVQAMGERSAEERGTGLGLAISRRLAEAMGGSLGVKSDLGVGSVFILRLPKA